MGASSNGKGHGGTGAATAATGRPGRREADGGWGISWCKDTTWGQLIAIAAGTTGVIKVSLLLVEDLHRFTHDTSLQIMQIYESRSHRTILTLPHSSSSDSAVAPAVSGVAWAPSCGRRYQLIASGGRDGRVMIWKLTPPNDEQRATLDWNYLIAGTFDDHQSAVTRVEWNVTG
jgi:nucleoporin SEH1